MVSFVEKGQSQATERPLCVRGLTDRDSSAQTSRGARPGMATPRVSKAMCSEYRLYAEGNGVCVRKRGFDGASADVRIALEQVRKQLSL